MNTTQQQAMDVADMVQNAVRTATFNLTTDVMPTNGDAAVFDVSTDKGRFMVTVTRVGA